MKICKYKQLVDINVKLWNVSDARVLHFAQKVIKIPLNLMNSTVLQLLQNNFLLIFIFLNFILLGERPFKCHICQKAFKQSSDLKKHINLHTGANQFKCEECNMEFRRADALRKHKLGHKVGNMPCGHCGKNFLHIGALRAHRAMHNGKTDKKYL